MSSKFRPHCNLARLTVIFFKIIVLVPSSREIEEHCHETPGYPVEENGLVLARRLILELIAEEPPDFGPDQGVGHGCELQA